MAFPSAYHADSDADDEYERSVLTSPVIPGDDDDGSHSGSGHSTEHTPTTFDTPNGDKSSPKAMITQWSSDECAKFLTSLNLSQYCNPFIENEIDGEALIALGHDELKEMGINSAGHRLTILKGVYDIKIKQDITIEADDYIPPSAEVNLNNKKATQDDISRIIQSMRLRDEQMLRYEAEIKRITEEYRKLREELLPVFKWSKERQPLPSPYGPNSPDLYNQEISHASPILAPPPPGNGIGVSRKGSRKGPSWMANTPKNVSPTYPPSTILEGKIEPDLHYLLNPSIASTMASSHLTVSATGGAPSPNPASLPSPTSPNNHYSNHQSSTRLHSDDRNGPRTGRSHMYDDGSWSSTASTIIAGEPFRTAPLSAMGNRSRTNTRGDMDDVSTTGSTAPSVEIFKSFRVSMDDPCHKVLPAALKKYNIQADWRQYALYIVYGDQERCLGLEEKPLILFKQLDKEGKKPMFMLRRHAPPSEGHSGPSGMMSFDGGMSQRSQSSFPLPGGVL